MMFATWSLLFVLVLDNPNEFRFIDIVKGIKRNSLKGQAHNVQIAFTKLDLSGGGGLGFWPL